MDPNREEYSTPGTPVMDIQRPSSQPPAPQGPTVIQPSNSLNRPATMEYTRPRPDDPNAPSFTPEPSQAFTPPVGGSSVKPKKSKKGLVITLFILLILGLGAAGGAYYYFKVYKKPVPVPAVTTETPAPAQSDSIEATPEGVDKVTDSIDQKLNGVNDTEDFKPNDVSDDGLGL